MGLYPRVVLGRGEVPSLLSYPRFLVTNWFLLIMGFYERVIPLPSFSFQVPSHS